MHNISMTQALSLWTDLEKAYHGTNSFGGDTAEIYIYRLMPRSPLAESALNKGKEILGFGMAEQEAKEVIRRANTSLFNLLAYFQEVHSDSRTFVKITLGDQELGPWLKEAGLQHRVHVQIKAQER
jgi:hypothetical protein